MYNTSKKVQPRPRILVADDSKLTLKSVHRILADDFEVTEVESGREALALLKTDSNFHTLFVDIMMPGMDGFEVLKCLRESRDGYLRHLPVIMMTSDDDSASLRRKAMVMGATDFITKPFDSLILKTRARAHARVPDDYMPLETKIEAVETSQEFSVAVMEYHDFEQIADRRMTESYANGNPVSLLCLKVDAFEALCQITGKEEADSVMEQTGQLIASQLSSKDNIATMGEGNFIILMPDTSAKLAKEQAKNIFTTVRKCHPDLGNMRINITLSGGMVSDSGENPHTLEKLENIASARLNKASEEGGNQLVYADLKKKKQVSKVERKLTLKAALDSLKNGDSDVVDQQIPELLGEAFPLLVAANAKMKLGIDEALTKIQDTLKEPPR